MYDITAEEWHFVVTTPLTQDPDDTILNRLQGYNRPKSYSILFRQWTDVPDRQYGVQTGTAFREFIQSEFGANVVGPIYANYRSILNAYEPKAADVIKFMADGVVESGIYDACMGVLVGWDLSNEADDVRQFEAPLCRNSSFRCARASACSLTGPRLAWPSVLRPAPGLYESMMPTSPWRSWAGRHGRSTEAPSQ